MKAFNIKIRETHDIMFLLGNYHFPSLGTLSLKFNFHSEELIWMSVNLFGIIMLDLRVVIALGTIMS